MQGGLLSPIPAHEEDIRGKAVESEWGPQFNSEQCAPINFLAVPR